MDKRYLTELPTPLTVAALTECARLPDSIALAKITALAVEFERDAMTLALRLYGESPDTMSPETIEVMRRWGPRCAALLMGETNEQHDDRPDGRPDMHVSTGPGDMDLAGRPLKPGT